MVILSESVLDVNGDIAIGIGINCVADNGIYLVVACVAVFKLGVLLWLPERSCTVAANTGNAIMSPGVCNILLLEVGICVLEDTLSSTISKIWKSCSSFLKHSCSCLKTQHQGFGDQTPVKVPEHPPPLPHLTIPLPACPGICSILKVQWSVAQRWQFQVQSLCIPCQPLHCPPHAPTPGLQPRNRSGRVRSASGKANSRTARTWKSCPMSTPISRTWRQSAATCTLRDVALGGAPRSPTSLRCPGAHQAARDSRHPASLPGPGASALAEWPGNAPGRGQEGPPWSHLW